MSRMEQKKNRHNYIYIKRLLFIKSVSFFVFALLIVRLFQIQIMDHNFYREEVMKQRFISIPTSSGRGIIYDRNFIPLTDRKEEKVLVVFPQYFAIAENNMAFLQEITGKSYEELYNRIKNSKTMIEFPLANEVDWNDRRIVASRGLFIISKKLRYDEANLLAHTIGYINQVDLKGMSGIEAAFDGTLSGNSANSLLATLDGRKRFLPGEGFTVSGENLKNQNLRLTIDYNIQKIIEKVVDESRVEGAIIVSDVNSGEILAMSSRPNFNPNRISEHLNSKGDELYNKAIQMAFPPGSTFKIVVALEALKQNPNIEHEVFNCAGYEDVGEIEIKCSSYDKGGHGEITIERAFAESCNCVFIQLAKRIGAENIINTAKDLGFNEIVNIGLGEEVSGNLPKGDELLGPAYGNIAIGQGEILVTPLQVNQLTQLVANNGLKKPLYMIKDIVNKDYQTLKEPIIRKEEQVLDAEITRKIKGWMEKVMLEGTGQQAGHIAKITAGKTGSAESVEKGREVVHAWFTGYYPSQEPKYAITVFVQKGRSGGGVAVPIFTKIVDEMINNGYK